MATTATSIEEYLKTVPDPDVEYVDGELRERPMVFSVHGRLQSEICIWFGAHRKVWMVLTGIEIRTQVSPTRVRLPDVIVDRMGVWPDVFSHPPMIVIEILSASDSFMELEQKCADYSAMGIRNIWVINPERQSGRTWIDGALVETRRFAVAGTEIYLDLPWLFAQMDSDEA